MRRDYLLIALSIACALLAVLWYAFAPAYFLAIPDTFSYRADVVSNDNFYDESRGEFKGPQWSVTKFYYEADGKKDGVLDIKNVFDVRTTENEPIFAVERHYGIDPKTGAHVSGYGDKDRQGYLFAPRHLQVGQNFTYWHINYDGPAHMYFQQEEVLDGLPVFRYETHYEGVRIDQTENLTFLPGVGTQYGIVLEPHLDVWIEPTTGYLVKYTDETTAYYYDLHTGKILHPWNRFSNTYSEQSVEAHVQHARSALLVAHAVEWYVPGVLVLFALVLCCLHTRLFAQLRRYVPARFQSRVGMWGTLAFVGLLLVVVTFFLSSFIRDNFVNQARLQFAVDTARATDQLAERLNIYVNALQGGKGLFAASNSVERNEWKAYVNALDIQKAYPGIQGMGYAVFVTPEQKAEHEKAVQAEGFLGYHIHPEGDRDMYSSIIYIEPFNERNKQAFGFDMFQETVQRRAMEESRDTGLSKMSGRITLVQEIDSDIQPGFLIYVPQYKNGAPTTTVEERQHHIVGYVYAAFRARDFIEGTWGKGGLDGVAVSLYDGTEVVPENVLYDDTTQKIGNSTPRFLSTRTIYVAGRPWLIVFKSTATYGQTFLAEHAVDFALAVGLLVSCLIVIFLYTLMSSRERAVTYADSVTKDLRERSNKLEEANTEGKRLLDELAHAQKDVQEKLTETKRLNNIMIGRELKMIELKDELKKLKGDV